MRMEGGGEVYAPLGTVCAADHGGAIVGLIAETVGVRVVGRLGLWL